MKVKTTKGITWGIALFATFIATAAIADGKRDSDNAFKFVAIATGAQEVPTPATSDAVGRVVVRFDRGLTKAQVRLRLNGITSGVLAAHLHCNRAGLNAPPAFGLLNPGPLTEIGDRATVTLTNADAVADCTGFIGRPVNNIAALYFAMRDGLIYFNLHTADFPAGELRGQFIPQGD